MLLKAQAQAASSGISNTTESWLAQYDLDNYDCDKCNNTGSICWHDENYVFHSEKCECKKVRRSIRSLRKSGMMDMIERYTFENYETPDAERRRIKETAQAFCRAKSGWLYIHGRAGSGKTHICTAVCNSMIMQGNSLKYMLWRDESVELKALVNYQEDYNERMQRLKTVKVLYIDDFFKSKNVTDADINLAFELLNYRYNDSKLRTIISSEKSIEDILSYDEAVGSRIYERCKNGFYIDAPDENWRLK